MSPIKPKTVFVTVGTTQFPKLIAAVSSTKILNTLAQLGYSFVQLQIGTEKNHELESVKHPTITLKYDTYFENFQEKITSSDLVICHAGAGSCLEVLRLKKPLIVVCNEELMDNHQSELARMLEKERYAYCCIWSTLNQTLQKDLSLLREYPECNKEIFANYLDDCMGFTK